MGTQLEARNSRRETIDDMTLAYKPTVMKPESRRKERTSEGGAEAELGCGDENSSQSGQDERAPKEADVGAGWRPL